MGKFKKTALMHSFLDTTGRQAGKHWSDPTSTSGAVITGPEGLMSRGNADNTLFGGRVEGHRLVEPVPCVVYLNTVHDALVLLIEGQGAD